MYKNNSDPIRLCPTPWQLQGEAYILNCWLNPEFLKQALFFGLAPSFFRSSYSSHVGEVIALALLVLIVAADFKIILYLRSVV